MPALKRKSSVKKSIVKRKRSNNWYLQNPRAEVKWFNTAINAGTGDAYYQLSLIPTGGEYDRRIGNTIHARSVQFKLATISLTTILGAYRIMVVQSKQGQLAGSNGISDSPGFQGNPDHKKYRVLYDQYHSYQYGDDDQNSVAQATVTVNKDIRYKNEPTTSYDCDCPVYFWIISKTAHVQSNTHVGYAVLYYSDV